MKITIDTWDRVKNHHTNSWSEPRIEGEVMVWSVSSRFDFSHASKKDRAFLIFCDNGSGWKNQKPKNKKCKQFQGNDIVAMDHHHEMGMLGKQDCLVVHKSPTTSRCIGKSSPLDRILTAHIYIDADTSHTPITAPPWFLPIFATCVATFCLQNAAIICNSANIKL